MKLKPKITHQKPHPSDSQVVDLRWGIPNTQATDYLTTELCLEELERCQKTSIGPAFVVSVSG